MGTYRVSLRHGTVTIRRTVQAVDSDSAVLAAFDETGFWSSAIVESVERVTDA